MQDYHLRDYDNEDNKARFPKLHQASLIHLQRLYTYLIAPLETDLNTYTKWIIVPDGILHYIPFHALHNGNTYVIAQHEIVYTPNAGVLKFCHRRPIQRKSHSLIMGCTSDGQLPHVLDEINTIAPLLLPNLMMFTESQAKSSYLKEYASDCDIIHLASHGALLDHNPRLSYIQMADTQLSVDQVYALNLDTSLVTLSACETGIGTLQGGDIIGLARGFFYAGTASLLVSLWTVDDASTALLMKAFYRHLRDGMTKAAALRAAQLEMIRTEDKGDILKNRYKHPYYWAPFYLMGADGMVEIAKQQLTSDTTTFKSREQQNDIENTNYRSTLSEQYHKPIKIQGGNNNHTDFYTHCTRTIEPFSQIVETWATPVNTLVTRYTDIVCPKQVWLETPRVSVIVRLTTKQPAFSAAVQELQIQNDIPIQVRIDAPIFEILNHQTQMINILENADSPPLVFDLRPRQKGETHIALDFSQGGNPVGTISVPIKVTTKPVYTTEHATTSQTLHVESNTLPPDFVLYIGYPRTATQSRLTFRLSRQGEIEQEFHSRLLEGPPQTYTNRLYNRLTQLTQRLDPTTQAVIGKQRIIPPDDVDRQLRHLGQDLWRSLIPDDLKSLYAAERTSWHDKTLLVVSDEPYIPWELIWPYGHGWSDDGPWCMTLYLTRWLRQNAQGNGHSAPPTRLPIQSLACLAPTDSGLRAAQQERQFLEHMLAQHQLENTSPTVPSWSKVIDLLEDGRYSWLHAAAHGNFYAPDPDADTAIWLQDTRALTPSALVGPQIEGHIKAQRPGFVFNACHSGREGWAMNHLGGWANRLISNGAGLFLAPLWTVTDSSALIFAQTWYQAIFEGKTVADATRSARRAAKRDGDPTWLSYSLYAHPNARLIIRDFNPEV